MKYTNKHKLPVPIASAILQSQKEYDSEGSDLSASSITVSPKQYWLQKRHDKEIEVDVIDLYRSWVGTTLHSYCESVAEKDKNLIVEVRYSAQVEGWKISAKIDRYDKKKQLLTDLKFSAVYALTSPVKDDYRAQLSVQKWLMELSGIKVKKAQLDISAIDWYNSRVIQSDYPKKPSKSVTVDLWDTSETALYVHERVKLLQSYQDTPDDDIPVCTDAERWREPTKYAVMKDKKAKRATRVYNSPLEAEIHAKQIQGFVEVREGEDKKCTDYCQCKKFCNYWKEHYRGDNE